VIGLRTFRNIVTAALVIATPVATSMAATRPNVAVPTAAAASSSAAQYDDGNSMAGAWLPIGIIVATILVGIWIASKDSSGHGDLSRG
jgi:hypothetical protein